MMPIDHTTWIEIAFCLYATAALITAITHGSGASIFMGLYVLGFGSVSITSLREFFAMRPARSVRKRTWTFSNSQSD
jgi:hypothetical protein